MPRAYLYDDGDSTECSQQLDGIFRQESILAGKEYSFRKLFTKRRSAVQESLTGASGHKKYNWKQRCPFCWMLRTLASLQYWFPFQWVAPSSGSCFTSATCNDHRSQLQTLQTRTVVENPTSIYHELGKLFVALSSPHSTHINNPIRYMKSCSSSFSSLPHRANQVACNDRFSQTLQSSQFQEFRVGYHFGGTQIKFIKLL